MTEQQYSPVPVEQTGLVLSSLLYGSHRLLKKYMANAEWQNPDQERNNRKACIRLKTTLP